MTDLVSGSNEHMPQVPRSDPFPAPDQFAVEDLPVGLQADLRRLEYDFKLDVEDRRLAEKSMELEDRRATRGQWMAFILALVFLGVLGAAVLTDAHLVAAGLMGSGIAVGVGSFIYGHRQEQRGLATGSRQRSSSPASSVAPESETA